MNKFELVFIARLLNELSSSPVKLGSTRLASRSIIYVQYIYGCTCNIIFTQDYKIWEWEGFYSLLDESCDSPFSMWDNKKNFKG